MILENAGTIKTACTIASFCCSVLNDRNFQEACNLKQVVYRAALGEGTREIFAAVRSHRGKNWSAADPNNMSDVENHKAHGLYKAICESNGKFDVSLSEKFNPRIYNLEDNWNELSGVTDAELERVLKHMASIRAGKA